MVGRGKGQVRLRRMRVPDLCPKAMDRIRAGAFYHLVRGSNPLSPPMGYPGRHSVSVDGCGGCSILLHILLKS